MSSLPFFELPLPSGAPPTGFGWSGSGSDPSSKSMEFEEILDQRDRFFGMPACVICGDDSAVCYCHIIPQDELNTWKDLKTRGWIPPAAGESPADEPRNGMVMCPNHHANFNAHQFFIRFSPETKKFIFIKYSDYPNFDMYHGKAIALDPQAQYAPFASLFIIHEWRVRGHNPFQPIIPAISAKVTWQDWITLSGVYDIESGFKHDTPSGKSINVSQLPAWPQFYHTLTTEASTSMQILSPPTDAVVAEILAATHAMPSWRACELENTSWDGTAEENTKKYLDISGGGIKK